jgi:excisionase family DNA binding protein
MRKRVYNRLRLRFLALRVMLFFRGDVMELLLTVEQAAQQLQCSQATVRRLLGTGDLRGIKRGKLWRIPESALMEQPQRDARKAAV